MSVRGRIDPGRDRLCRRFRLVSDETFGVSAEGTVERDLAGSMDLVGLTEVHLVGRHQAYSGMVMDLIVPVEEAAAERLGVLDAAETLRKLRLVFHGFEVALRERIIVGGVQPTVRRGDAEICEQQRGSLGSHRATTVGMQGELTDGYRMFGDGVLEQRRE